MLFSMWFRTAVAARKMLRPASSAEKSNERSSKAAVTSRSANTCWLLTSKSKNWRAAMSGNETAASSWTAAGR